MMRCENCNQWEESAEGFLCKECTDVIFEEMKRAGAQETQEKLEDALLHLDNVMSALRTQLKLHEKEWRSNEVEYPADQEAKQILEEAEEWLHYANQKGRERQVSQELAPDQDDNPCTFWGTVRMHW